MNKTHELLLNLKNIVMRDASALKHLSAYDIISCVYMEFEGVKQLYNNGQMKEIDLLLKNLSAELSEGITSGNGNVVCQVLDRIIEIHNSFPDSTIALDFIEEANFNKAYIRHKNMKTTIVLGDSHVNYFSGNEELSFKPIGRFIDTCDQVNELPLTCLHLGANLAYTSDESESSEGFKEKLDYLFENFITEEAAIIACFGEIDIRAHVFKETERQNRSYRDIVDDILDHYERFLTSLKSRGYRVACWGPIASQKDKVPVTAKFPRFGSEIDRNKATEYFNNSLGNWCNSQNIPFMSMYYEMVTDNYETKEEYLSSDGVHLGQYSYEILTNSKFLSEVIQNSNC